MACFTVHPVFIEFISRQRNCGLIRVQASNRTKSFILHAANSSNRRQSCQHGTIEEVLKHVDGSKYAIPDDWLEPSERAEKRKQVRQEAKLRKEARAKEEAKIKVDTTTEEKEADTKPEANDVAEESKTSAAKRERETEKGEDSEEELDDTPPMYRQARGLFLKPEVWTTPRATKRQLVFHRMRNDSWLRPSLLQAS